MRKRNTLALRVTGDDGFPISTVVPARARYTPITANPSPPVTAAQWTAKAERRALAALPTEHGEARAIDRLAISDRAANLCAVRRTRGRPMRVRYGAIAEACIAAERAERQAFVRPLRQLRARGEAADARGR